RQGGEVFTEQRGENRPELIARMRIILSCCQRCGAGKTAEYQNFNLAIEDRRQSGQEAGWHGGVVCLHGQDYSRRGGYPGCLAHTTQGQETAWRIRFAAVTRNAK